MQEEIIAGPIPKEKRDEIVENSSEIEIGIFNPRYLELFAEHLREHPDVIAGSQVVIRACKSRMVDVGFLFAEIQSDPVKYIGVVGEEIIHGN